MPQSTGEVSRLLAEWMRGQPHALDRLIPLVYQELRRAARVAMKGERAGHTLQPTCLVHEVFLELVAQDHANWRNRTQFVAIASQMMRRILVHHARRRAALKRGGAVPPATLTELEPRARWNAVDVLAVDQALDRLAHLDSQQARIVELRWFGGLSVEETAEALAVSSRTVKRDWAMAMHWMRRELAPGGTA
jgi:RNA polymerase sigma factor (TIGR02999 family)